MATPSGEGRIPRDLNLGGHFVERNQHPGLWRSLRIRPQAGSHGRFAQFSERSAGVLPEGSEKTPGRGDWRGFSIPVEVELPSLLAEFPDVDRGERSSRNATSS
jgi:hypothetical protein